MQGRVYVVLSDLFGRDGQGSRWYERRRGIYSRELTRDCCCEGGCVGLCLVCLGKLCQQGFRLLYFRLGCCLTTFVPFCSSNVILLLLLLWRLRIQFYHSTVAWLSLGNFLFRAKTFVFSCFFCR